MVNETTNINEGGLPMGGALLSLALPPLCRVGSIVSYGTREGISFSDMPIGYVSFFCNAIPHRGNLPHMGNLRREA